MARQDGAIEPESALYFNLEISPNVTNIVLSVFTNVAKATAK
jgi:hypothetical protein